MEIRICRRLTGRELKERIQEKYGDHESVQAQAEGGNPDAKDALFNLSLLDEDPSRLDEELVIEDILVLDRNDLSKLTETRLRILQTLRDHGEVNLKELTAYLKRDPKNVSRDVAYLESFGLVEAHRHGKEKCLQAAGNEILISV